MFKYKVGKDTYTIPNNRKDVVNTLVSTYPEATPLSVEPEDPVNKLDELASITQEIKNIAGDDMEMDNMDSPNRIIEFNKLVEKYNKVKEQINPLYLNQRSYEGNPLYTGGESMQQYQESTGSVFTEEGGAKLRQIQEGFDPLDLDEVVVTGEKYKEISQNEENKFADELMKMILGDPDDDTIALSHIGGLGEIVLGKTGEKIIDAMASVTDPKQTGKDMSALTSSYNTIVNAFNQINTVDNRAGLTLAALLSNTDILPNTFGWEESKDYRKYWQDTYIKFSKDLDKRNKVNRQTIGFTDLPEGKASYIGGGLAASFNAFTAFGTSAAISASTYGVGLATDMIGSSIQEFNNQKAASLGITLDQLVESGQAETLTPVVLGTAGFLLERAGLKSAIKYINGAPLAQKGALYTLLNLPGPGTTNAVTEWTQFGLEELNRNLATGLTLEEASKNAFETMKSNEGIETLLQGYVGGKGVSVVGRTVKRAMRTKAQNERISNYVRKLGVLENSKYQKNLTTEQINQIEKSQQEIIKKLTETYNENDQLIAALTPAQIKQIEEGSKLLQDLNKKRQGISQNTSVDKKTRDDMLQENQDAINAVSQGIYDIRNTAEKLASNIQTAKDVSRFIDKLEVQDLEDSKAVEKFIKERGLEKEIPKEAPEQQAFIYQDPKTNEQIIIINREFAATDKAVAAPFHETLHALLYKTLKSNPEAAIRMRDALKSELDKLDPSQVENPAFKRRLKSYKDKTEEMQAEEYLTLFVEALNTGNIKYKENFATKVGDVVRRNLQNLGVNIKFNEGRDVYNALKDFNKSMEKGNFTLAQVLLAKEGAEGELIKPEQKSKVVPKKRVSLSKRETQNVNNLAEQYNENRNDKKLEKDLIDQYESVAVAALGYDVRRGTVAPEEALSFVRSQFKSIIDRFDPTKAAFTTHVNANIVPKRQQFYDQLIGDEALTTSIDAPESRQIADTTPEVETTTIKEDKKPTTNPLKLFGLDEKAKTNFVEKTVKELKKLNVNELTYKTLRTLDEQGIADLVGIPAKKIFSPAANLSQPEARKALMFINKNARAIINLLPENNTEVKEVEAKNKPGKKVSIGGLPTGVPRNIQKLFYNKGKRIGNNFQFTKKKDITVESFKKALGIEGNVKSPTFKVRSSTSQALKGMLELIGRAATNTAARQYLQEIGTDPRIIENIGEGRNPVMFSKRNQDVIYDALSAIPDGRGKDAIVESIAEEIRVNPKLINNTEYLEGVIDVALEEAVLAGKEGAKFTKETDNLNYYNLVDKNKLNFKLKPTESLRTIGKKRLKLENTKDVNNFIKNALEITKAINTEDKILLGRRKSFIPGALVGYHRRSTGDGKLEEFYKALDTNTKPKWVSEKTQKLFDKVKTIIPASSFKNVQKKISEAKTKEEKIKIAKQNLPALREHQESAKNFFNAFNSLLTDYLYDSKNQKEFENRLDYILKLKRLNSDNVKGERDLVALDGFYLGEPDGPIKLEHVKSSSQQSVQSLKSIVSGTWDTSIANDFKGMFGYKNKFDEIDAYGKTNTSKYYRFYDKNEASKYVLSEFGFEGTIYDKNLISAIQEDLIKSEKLAAPFNNEKLPSVVKFSKRQDYTNDMVLERMAELDLEQAEAQIKFSKSQNLSDDFNKIIENKTGIGAEKVYSDVKAQVVGASKGRFNFFIPPSAEDFMGLLYKTLGKGKLGDAQMAWYKKNLLDPFARAMDNISRDRIALQNDFKKLKQDLKIVPKNLRKKITGEPYTQEQAVRVYIWNLQGMRPEGMSQTDINELVSFVESKPELVTFANELIRLQKGDSYPAPKFGWLAGTITTDLMDGINTIKRAKYLEQWQYNADEIFSRANLNKLEAAYGKNYRVALEGILKRMRTGRNREFNSDTLTGRVTDWLTNSIGAIMFFNTRSAVLQTISAVNFINFKDNNIFAAGKAFANQPQFWKDFMTLMNSDFLVDRRNGLRLNVNENDIADMAKKGGVRGVISEMLRLGFLPTQIADSFAIASGGATFYRNRIKSLQKQGKSKAEAEKEAFLDFREIAEESQQSSRPDRISQQQASPLGRIILAFANTPMQYTRLIKKAASDLKNGRGDAKTNISKIFYYGFAQNLLFNAMQQALFAIGFGDDDETLEEKEKKKQKKYISILNSMADSILRGLGVGGAIVSVLKNTATKLYQEGDKKRPEYQDVVVKEILQISPPISSKVGKVKAAFRTYDWNKKEIMEKGFSLDNPAYLAAGQLLAAGFNIPLDRAFKKIENIRNASSSDYEAWARIAMLAGWADWELGVKPEEKLGPNQRRKTTKTRSKKAKSRSKKVETRKK